MTDMNEVASGPRQLASLTRRYFLMGAAALGAGASMPLVDRQSALAARAVSATEMQIDDLWLGPDLWANRLQDWAVTNGRITCVAALGVRTAALLTQELSGGPATLVVKTGTQTAGNGFSGFLIGTGEVGTDFRRAALVGTASGAHGGLLCVYGSDGVACFRRHTDERNQFAYPRRSATTSGPTPVARSTAEEINLVLKVVPDTSGTLTLTLTARDSTTGVLRSRAILTRVAVSTVAGGIALVSSGAPSPGATYWFSGVRATGSGVLSHPERAFGPIAGTLFSLTGSTLKMTAQLVPMVLKAGDTLTLSVRDTATGSWSRRASAPVGAGFAAIMRVDDWDSGVDWDYQVEFSRGGSYTGHVPAEPNSGELTVATLCCTAAVHRPFDVVTSGAPKLPGETALGLYSSKNVWFPYEQLASNLLAQQPDMLVALGDQFYENSPTYQDLDPAPEIDFLYKYLQWLWAFRKLTRRIPCIIAIDDHDVYQGNLWGEGGVPLPAGSPQNNGGYAKAPDWVNIVQRVQCGHNPDPVDPAPVAQGISVYFTKFQYGQVRFVLLEDRKFKTGGNGRDPNGATIPVSELVLLGDRQESLLQSLQDDAPIPTVILSQTLYGCLETKPDGTPATDRDSNGWPPLARARALRLIKAARAVMLSGDTHLASLVRHGIDRAADGPIQFTAPAGCAFHQRWFEPAKALANGTGLPYTGDYVDSFGNAMRVLAVANMDFTQRQVLAAYGSPAYGHREFKKEGYGLLRTDLTTRKHTFEAWRWDTDPTETDARPMPGWPYILDFDDA